MHICLTDTCIYKNERGENLKERKSVNLISMIKGKKFEPAHWIFDYSLILSFVCDIQLLNGPEPCMRYVGLHPDQTRNVSFPNIWKFISWTQIESLIDFNSTNQRPHLTHFVLSMIKVAITEFLDIYIETFPKKLTISMNNSTFTLQKWFASYNTTGRNKSLAT